MKFDDFTAPGTGGDFKLSTHKGRPVVLYFYPKDNTPGARSKALSFETCTKSSRILARLSSAFRATA